MDKHVLIYDSECSLCVRFKKALEFVDTENLIIYKSVYDPSVYVDFPELNQERCEEEIHLVSPDKKVYKGAEVIAFLITILPAVKKFAWLIDSDSAKEQWMHFMGNSMI